MGTDIGPFVRGRFPPVIKTGPDKRPSDPWACLIVLPPSFRRCSPTGGIAGDIIGGFIGPGIVIEILAACSDRAGFLRSDETPVGMGSVDLIHGSPKAQIVHPNDIKHSYKPFLILSMILGERAHP